MTETSGFLERPERVVLLIIGALADRMAPVLWTIAILGNSRPELRAKLHAFRQEQTDKVRADTLP